MASLVGKVVIITGASSGIGASTAVHLAQHSPKLVLAARRLEKLKDVAEECTAKGMSSENIFIHHCDVNKDEDMNDLVKRTVEKFNKIDVLVNNAGFGHYGSIHNMPIKAFDGIMSTNIRAPFYLSQLCIPHLIKTQGSIINVSSISGQRSFPQAIAYCCSKAALDHFTRTLSVDLAPHKVRVNSVNPGVIITEFQRSAGMKEESYEIYLESQKKLQPLTGAIQPEEVAKAIKFFASDESSSITGELLFIDGGRHAKSAGVTE